eukprot:COSAG06_NODE_983_length_11201_cov_8.679697_9_plen_97_part_00
MSENSAAGPGNLEHNNAPAAQTRARQYPTGAGRGLTRALAARGPAFARESLSRAEHEIGTAQGQGSALRSQSRKSLSGARAVASRETLLVGGSAEA